MSDSSWWAKTARKCRCFWRSSAPIIDVAEITETDSVFPADSARGTVTAVIIGLRDRWWEKGDSLELEKTSPVFSQDSIFFLYLFSLRAWLSDPTCVTFCLYHLTGTCLSQVPLSLKLEHQKGGTRGTVHSQDLSRNDNILDSFKSWRDVRNLTHCKK